METSRELTNLPMREFSETLTALVRGQTFPASDRDIVRACQELTTVLERYGVTDVRGQPLPQLVVNACERIVELSNNITPAKIPELNAIVEALSTHIPPIGEKILTPERLVERVLSKLNKESCEADQINPRYLSTALVPVLCLLGRVDEAIELAGKHFKPSNWKDALAIAKWTEDLEQQFKAVNLAIRLNLLTASNTVVHSEIIDAAIDVGGTQLMQRITEQREPTDSNATN